MKQKLKQHKGITLIALIITIIVLLILAVVAINAIKGDGIISHAKNAKSQYSGAQTNEQAVLSDYELMLSQETGNAWKQEKVKVTKGDTTLNVGDEVKNFTAGGKTWKVLGAEKGKLLLTTTENVNNSFKLNGGTAGWSETEKRFVAAEKALDEECKSKITLTDLTDAIKSKVTEVRSIKLDDIDRIIEFVKEDYNKGKISGYGNKVTYSVVKDENETITGIKYESTIESGTSTDWKQFKLPNTLVNITNPYTATSTAYNGNCSGLIKDNFAAFNMLLGTYSLASSYVNCSKGVIGFGMYEMSSGSFSLRTLWNTANTPINR